VTTAALEAAARAALDDSLAAQRRCLPALAPAVAALAAAMVAVLRGGGKVVWLGNGGSAAQAQHGAAELVGRFERERAALAALSLTVDTSILTAVGNDYGYAEVFARQVRALVRRGDLVVALSTSGRSPNVLQGLAAAREVGAITAGLTGATPGPMAPLCDHLVAVDAARVPHVQEAHMVVVHLLCGLVEGAMAGALEES
jgi:D-sedoheptulose 7-phosphate isomerase